MAKKKQKKQMLARKQAKQQRRKSKTKKRKQSARAFPAGLPHHADEEWVDDVLPLLQASGDPSAPVAVERLMMTILASEDMAEEPEFEDVIFDPWQCVNTFAAVYADLGITPDPLDKQTEKREDISEQIQEEIAKRLLTDEIRRDILSALNKLRLRLKRSGNRQATARAALLHASLDGMDQVEQWSASGLIRALIGRSMSVGFELFEATEQVHSPKTPEEAALPLVDRVARSSAAQKAEELQQRVPGLQKFLQKQADAIRDEGYHAIYKGDLYLGLFSREELVKGFEILSAITGSQDAENPPDFSKENLSALVLRLNDYLTELLTPERVRVLQKRLRTILEDPPSEKKWGAFVLMISGDMNAENAVEYEKPFLLRAFIGEMGRIEEELRGAGGHPGQQE